MCITATGKLNGHDLKDLPVLNPGDWFGKTWLLEIGGSYSPLFLIVESDSAQDAIDELADNTKYCHNIIVDDTDLGDYPEEDRHYSGSGHVLDLDHLLHLHSLYAQAGHTPGRRRACPAFGRSGILSGQSPAV